MKPSEGAEELARRAAALRAAGTNVDVSPLLQAARETAAAVKAAAASNRHSVGVRIVAKSSGIRVTLTGPHAQRYRKMMADGLDRRAPAAKAEIRANITRRAR